MANETLSNKQAIAGASPYYDADYFDWQKNLGAFGGWANAKIFQGSISRTDTVIDFGCGGGFLLKNLECRKRIGIEPNPSAGEAVKKSGIHHFLSPTDALHKLGAGCADVIVSTNALEHALNPLQELKNLAPLLKEGGVIHFVVPCESFANHYNPDDINHHLFSWSPQNLGNLFKEAGFTVDYVRPYVHKWPPLYAKIAKFGWPIFNLACRLYGHIERSWFQVEIKARKTAP